MPKNKPKIELYSYGIYSKWDNTSKELPKLKEITTKIPIEPEIEFGYVLKIRGARGQLLNYEIHHPPFKNEQGEIMPSFEGQVLIHSNDWEFFLGDTVWEPYNDKAGEWILISKIQDKEIARKKFILYIP